MCNNQNRFHNTRSKFKTHSMYNKLLTKPLIKPYSKIIITKSDLPHKYKQEYSCCHKSTSRGRR